MSKYKENELHASLLSGGLRVVSSREIDDSVLVVYSDGQKWVFSSSDRIGGVRFEALREELKEREKTRNLALAHAMGWTGRGDYNQ